MQTKQNSQKYLIENKGNINLSSSQQIIHNNEDLQNQGIYPTFNEQNKIKNENNSVQANTPTIIPVSNPSMTPITDTHLKQKKLNNSKVISNKKKIIIGLIIFLILAGIGLGVGLGVGLSKKQNNNENNDKNNDNNNNNDNDNNPNQPDVPIIKYTCEDFPEQCTKVPSIATEYILSNFSKQGSVRSMLQLSQTFNTLQELNTTDISNPTTKQSLANSYRQILRSLQCLSYYNPTQYSKMYINLVNLQFGKQNQTIKYLNMLAAFSGQPLKLTPKSELQTTCKFTFNNSLSNTNNILQTQQNIIKQQQKLLTQTNQANSSSCNYKKGSVLIYMSGIGYSPLAQLNVLKRIQQIIKTKTDIQFTQQSIAIGPGLKNGPLQFMYSLALIFQMKLKQNNIQFYNKQDYLDAIQLFFDLALLAQSGPFFPFMLTKIISQILLKQINDQLKDTIIDNSIQLTTQYHLSFIKQQLSQGKKIVLVAYSDSSIYANNVYKNLTVQEKKSISLVYIAPLSRSMEDKSNNYITNPYDLVIQAIKIYSYTDFNFYPPLSPNAEAIFFNAKYDYQTNHHILGYLDHYPDAIAQMINSAYSKIQFPPQTLGNGPLTVTLTWDTQLDIDLHIFEPGGYHIYYARKQGYSGYLDLDDVTSFGPEHYFTKCTMDVGNYTFRLNYYNGITTSNAIVTVAAGEQYFVKNLQLYPPIAQRGNSMPPYFVCSVIASKNEISGKYSFKINVTQTK